MMMVVVPCKGRYAIEELLCCCDCDCKEKGRYNGNPKLRFASLEIRTQGEVSPFVAFEEDRANSSITIATLYYCHCRGLADWFGGTG
jgi:hypothetical protein